MSVTEDDMTSQKDNISQIKMMMHMIINNKGHGNSVASTPGFPNPIDPTGRKGVRDHKKINSPLGTRGVGVGGGSVETKLPRTWGALAQQASYLG